MLATEAAVQLDILAHLPPDHSLAHHPLSSARPLALQFPHPQPIPAPRNPDVMKVDALGTCPPLSILDLARSICCSQKLCFRCLKPVIPGSHSGSINCLNAPVLPEQQKAFVDWARQTPTAQVTSLHTEQPSMQSEPTLTFCQSDQLVDSGVALPSPPSFPSLFDVDDLHGHNKFYKDLEEAKAAVVPVSTLHVCLDVLKGGRIVVPTIFKLAGGVMIPATILVDTVLMANFINDGFVQKHDLKNCQQKHPVQCVGFDSKEGVGGLVTQDWAGVTQLYSIDSNPVLLQACLASLASDW